jgi:hypothetical protein
MGIEVFHKILESGCKAEVSKLRTAQHLTNLVAVFRILSRRIFWMTTLNCSAPDALTLALTEAESAVCDRLVNDKSQARRKTLSHYLTRIARLGGYLARANDPPSGNTVTTDPIALTTFRISS